MTGNAVALVSAKGSPGVTTTALLLAAVWPTGATLLEADPAGGDLRTQFSDPTGQPLRPDRGVVSLLTAQASAGTSSDPDVLSGRLMEHSQQLPGGLPVVLGPSNTSQVEALRPQWAWLADVLRETRRSQSVVLDAGRLSDPSSLALTLPLLRTCDVTVVVARANVTSLSHTRDLLGLLGQVGLPTRLLLIADARDTLDVPTALGIPVDTIHVVPDDPVSAAALTGPWNRKLDRSRLLVAARRVAAALSNIPRHNTSGPEGEDLIDLIRHGAVSA